MATTAMHAAHRLARPILWRLRAEVTGVGRVPMAGGVLLAANHRSFLDHYLLSAACPRPMWYLGKRELGVGLVGRFNCTMGMIPVDRGHADLVAIERIVTILRDGDVVGVFPEGTRSRDGMLYRFRSGMARIAARAQVPVVPVGLLGTAEVWPPNTMPPVSRPEPGVLKVRFGPIRNPPGDTGRERRLYTRDIEDEVARLCEQPRTDRFADIHAAGDGAGG